MHIQIALNWAIQIIVMGIVTIMVMDFVNGLFSLPYYAIAPVATNSQALALQQEPAAAPIPELAITPDPCAAPQFEQLPDPWFTTDIQPTPIQTQPSVILPFPSLRLLAPASVVQPKARATKKSTQSATTKRTTKLTNKAATQNRSKGSKKSAA